VSYTSPSHVFALFRVALAASLGPLLSSGVEAGIDNASPHCQGKLQQHSMTDLGSAASQLVVTNQTWSFSILMIYPD